MRFTSNAMSYRRLMMRVFRLSYLTVLRFDNPDFPFNKWSRVKHLYDAKLNRLIFRFLATNKNSQYHQNLEVSQQRLFDATYYVVKRHLQNRLKIYAVTKCFPFGGFWAFNILSGINSVYSALIGIGVAVITGTKRIQCEELPAAKRTRVFLNFPARSFSYVPSAEKSPRPEKNYKVAFSLAEFIASEPNSFQDYLNVSVNEGAKRSSQSTEAAKTPSTLRELDRIAISLAFQPAAIWSFAGSFFYALGRTLLAFGSSRIALELEVLRSDLRGQRYARILRQIELAVGDIDVIYVVPYDDIGNFRYDAQFVSRITNVNYSQHITTAPGKTFDAGKRPSKHDAFREGEFPFYAYFHTGHAVGFTQLYKDIQRSKRGANKRFGCILPTTPTEYPEQVPMVLGYESTYPRASTPTQKSIALFDVPPHEFPGNLASTHLCGDALPQLRYIQKFLEEVSSAAYQQNIQVLLKPKYSLSNYDDTYRETICNLSDRYGAMFEAVDPYSNMADIIEIASGVVCFPYTSPLYLAKALEKPAIYYLPEVAMNRYFQVEGDYHVVSGYEALVEFLGRLKENGS
jgi:hypothetical protein